MKWTACSEAMPPKHQIIDAWVRAIDHAFRATHVAWDGTNWEVDSEPLDRAYGGVAMIITHWMPRPDAPCGFETGHGDPTIGVGRSRFA
jgi:hypothetical protein